MKTFIVIRSCIAVFISIILVILYQFNVSLPDSAGLIAVGLFSYGAGGIHALRDIENEAALS